MNEQWQIFFETFPRTVTCEQLPVKLPRFDLNLCDLAGAAADWCHQYLKDRKCPSDLTVFLTQKIINNLRVQWAAEPTLFGFRPEKEDYQALWLMQRVIRELNDICLNYATFISCHHPVLASVWWSSFVLKNSRRQMEDYIAVVPYLHTLFDVKDYSEASFYAIYDGHNGLDAAVYSSMYLHQFLVQSVYYPTNPEYALCEAFYATDKGFTHKTEKYNLVSGTTAVCALHRPHENKLYVGWVGDSIATLWKNGTPLCLVNKHVPERHDETQRIENEGGMVSKCQGVWRVDGQLAVSRAIGDVKYKPHITCQPDIRALVLDGNEEFLVLGSDGLWEYTTPEDVAETIYDELLEKDGDVSEIGNKLAFKSKVQGSKDNISVIVVFLQDPKHLVAKRRSVIMETAMEQRNTTATLASYGQDAGDFGPETDVDTPDEPTSLSKPKVEGEANVIDESGEDSEEDGSGWNYYKKSTETTEQKIKKENDNNTDNNSDTEDMDYKLNPDAPEFVPVSTPPLPTVNHAQRFINMDNDEFISSSPQKFKDSIDNVDVPNENDFTDEIKVHAADLSKLDNAYEPSDDCNMLNGIKSLNEEVISPDKTIDNFEYQNEDSTYKNPFAPEEKVDLNKVQDLSEYLNDDVQTYNTDPFISIMETNKNNELKSINNDNEFQNEEDIKFNDDLSTGEHLKYEQDMNSKIIDDSINTTNATVGSTLQLDDESFNHSDDYKNEIMNSGNIDQFGQYEDRKLNDSVSTTDAILGSEPHTPMRMDNQSTFESENDDDQFSESFKQQLQFNQFDEHNNKENHDPFCFEPTEDPEGIIPNVTHEVNEQFDEKNHISDNVQFNDNSSNEHQEIINQEPVEEPLFIKEEAKPFHSVYEQQDLPESDFSVSTHEALWNTTENQFNHYENNDNTTHSKEHGIVESQKQIEEDYVEQAKVEHLEQESKVSSHADDVELDDSDLDEIKDHVKDLKPELYHDHTCNFEEKDYTVNAECNLNKHLELEHNNINYEHVKDYTEENNMDIQIHCDDYSNYHQNVEIEKSSDNIDINIKQENNDIVNVVQDYVENSKQGNHFSADTIENNSEDFGQEYQNNVDAILSNNTDNLELKNQFYVEDVQNHVEDVQNHIEDGQNHVEDVQNHVEDVQNHVEDVQNHVKDVQNHVEDVQNHVEDVQNYVEDIVGAMQSHVEDFEQEQHNVVEVENTFDDFKHVAESKNNYNDDFKQVDFTETNDSYNEDFKHDNVAEPKNNCSEDLKQENENFSESVFNHNGDFQQEHHDPENHTVDSDEEMHSSMIIHADVENNMPQPYCSDHNTLMNEPNMMCSSMTFEENFQNRNMNDSLYVMETSSDYFGEEFKQTTQLENPVNETKVEDLNAENVLVEPSVNIENEILNEVKSELVSEPKIEDVKVESIQSFSQDPIVKSDKQEESNKVAEITIAAAVGAATVAAVTGVVLATKKSASKKVDTAVTKTKMTTTKTTTSPKPLASKPANPILKKTTLPSASKPLSRPTGNLSTSKPTTNIRPTTVAKTTTSLKATTVTKTAPKPAPKTTVPASRPISAKTTQTTSRTVASAKTTTTVPLKISPTLKSSTSPKLSSTSRTNTLPRTPTLVNKQPLTNGSPKPLSRPISAPAKKSLSSPSTNGTVKLANGTTKINSTTKLTNGSTKLTNGDVSKISTSTKAPVSLATRMSLAPPKLPPKVKVVSKTITPPAMPGPIRRPKAPITKKTETATS